MDRNSRPESAFLQHRGTSRQELQLCEDVMSIVLNILEIADVAKTTEEALSRISSALLSLYRGFFFSAYLRNDKGDPDCYTVLICKGFPSTKQRFENLVNENLEFMKPFETMAAPYFVDDFQLAKESLRGNLFHERSAAIIPLVSGGAVIGWYTLSTTDKGFVWSDAEKFMLVSIGRAVGAFVHLKLENDNLVRNMDGKYKADLAKKLQDAIGDVLGDSLRLVPSSSSDSAKAGEKKAQELLGSLTIKERQVLLELADGKTNAEISEALFVSNSTVKKHIESIFGKLNLNNRVQAAVFVEKFNLRDMLAK